MKNFTSLNTDFYQLSMIAAYIINDKANDITGFEGFARHIKSAVNSEMDFYIFDGENEINAFMDNLKEDLQDKDFIETFLQLVIPKVTADKRVIEKTIREKWKALNFEFEYNVVPNNSFVFPLVPVFQYKGPKWIGQLIETMITNIYNGRTGLATLKYIKNHQISPSISDNELNFLSDIMNNKEKALSEYARILDDTAYDFRMSAGSKILLEAAFRRCPSFKTAKMASEAAIMNGWNGTSNTTVVLNGRFDDSKIGGTMAHAFVMSFESEREAFVAWDKIFPGTTILIDTYDVINAAKMIVGMVKEGVIAAPNDVRIDSDPLDEYAKQVDEIFNETINGKKISKIDGRDPIGIFISGDMDIEKFEHFEFEQVPFSKAMAGTKYVYSNMFIEKLNSGFVYKIVEYVDNKGTTIRPEKKSNGKKNYSGLKQCSYNSIKNELTVWCQPTDGHFGFNNMDEMNINTKVTFKG